MCPGLQSHLAPGCDSRTKSPNHETTHVYQNVGIMAGTVIPVAEQSCGFGDFQHLWSSGTKYQEQLPITLKIKMRYRGGTFPVSSMLKITVKEINEFQKLKVKNNFKSSISQFLQLICTEKNNVKETKGVLALAF